MWPGLFLLCFDYNRGHPIKSHRMTFYNLYKANMKYNPQRFLFFADKTLNFYFLKSKRNGLLVKVVSLF